MMIKRTPVALALTSALFSIGAAAAALTHSPLPLHVARQHVDLKTANPLVGVDGKANIIIILKGEPAAVAYAREFQAAGRGTMAQAPANKVAQSTIANLKSAQAGFKARLQSSGIQYTEIYSVQRVLNGVAVRMRPADMQKVRALPDVERVGFLPVYQRPTNIASVPFVNAPQVWAGGSDSLGLPFNATGKGIKIGDIDTGLDYIHPDFGGTGALADYQDVDPASVVGRNSHNVIFPTAKVRGGFDFAGDAYDAASSDPNANTPQPDLNPMDCGGHGSHTAGTLGGLGVNSDGTPYFGIYNPVAPYSANLRIGPGVAPGADLYPLRVFGCSGNTSLVTAAIDWATDPNDNGDLSDHLDVINMSLGSPLGIDLAGDFDPEIEAINNAALVGLISVESAGNSGDTFFINGAPGAANIGLAVAASVDNGQTAPELHISSPTPAADYPEQPSGFVNPDGGSPPSPDGVSANIVLALDTTGGLSQGCGGASVPDPNAFSNAAALSGKLALIDRGACNFSVKIANAQAVGALGVIIDNNAANAALIFMGNTNPDGSIAPLPAPITVPSAFISLESGAAIKSDLASAPLVAALFENEPQPQLADTIAGFSSRGPVSGAGGAIELKPDVAAPGLNIPSAQTGITCDNVSFIGCLTPSVTGFLPNGQVLTISGTSMSAPHVTGLMALLRQLNPDMSIEQLKALAINGAAHDVTQGSNGSGHIFGASRVGAGRIDAAASASATVLAYNADVPGAVSVTFDAEPVGAAFSATHSVTLANRTATAQAVTLAVDTILDAPGVNFSVPSGTISIPAHGSTSFMVTLTADETQMTRKIDPTMATTQSSVFFAFAFPRQYLTEKSALIKVLDGATELARLPVYAALRPHSTLTTASDLGSTANLAGTTNLVLAGQDVCTGSLDAGPTCNFTHAGDEESFVTPFELQFTGAKDDTLPGFLNLHYVGVNSAPSTDVNGDPTTDLFFGIAAYGKWASPGYVAYNVCIDTDNDGLFDKILTNTDLGTLDQLFQEPNAQPQDTFFSAIYDNDAGTLGPEFPLNLADASQLDTGAHSNNTMFLAAQTFDLAIDPATTKIHYGLAVCPGFNPLCGSADWQHAQGTANCGTPDSAYASFNGPFTYDTAKPGVDGQFNILLEDLNGGSVQIPYDANNLSANGSSGMLLLHTHNTAATSAQVVIVDRIFADGFGGN